MPKPAQKTQQEERTGLPIDKMRDVERKLQDIDSLVAVLLVAGVGAESRHKDGIGTPEWLERGLEYVVEEIGRLGERILLDVGFEDSEGAR